MSGHIWSPSGGNILGITSAPWVRLQRLQFGVPPFNTRKQTHIIINVWPSCWLVAQSCLIVCDPTDCSMLGLPVQHQLPEFTQAHVHWVSDVIPPSHPLSSPSPPTFNLSQHQGLFQWISSSHQVAKVLELQLQHQSFQWIFRTDFL